MKTSTLIAALIVAVAAAAPVQAWEPTTHAGLAEQAVFASDLHGRLVELGVARGLFEPLTLPEADAPELREALRRLPASAAGTPNDAGTQPAWAWLVAGAAVSSQPHSNEKHHTAEQALAWLSSDQNPLRIQLFYEHWDKAHSSSERAVRDAHLAAALVAAGGVLHVVADVGVPARARGESPLTVSRLEMVARLAYSRGAVPGPSRMVSRSSLAGLISQSDEGPGLGTWVADHYYSEGTLPRAHAVTAAPALARPLPKAEGLALILASGDRGATLRNLAGTCLLRYVVRTNRVRYYQDDACLMEQAAAILPMVANYERATLAFLLRGRMQVTITGPSAHVVRTEPMGAGRLTVWREDAAGVRTQTASQEIAAGTTGTLGVFDAAGATRIVAVFVGADHVGAPVVGVSAATPAR